MPISITTNQTGAGVQVNLGATNNQSAVIAPGVIVVPSDPANAITGTGTGQSVSVAGYVGSQSVGVRLDGALGYVGVTSTGAIESLETRFNGSATALVYLAAGGHVSNAGLIRGEWCIGTGGNVDLYVTNSGLIEATITEAAKTSGNLTVFNTGSIVTITSISALTCSGVLDVTNTGLIRGNIRGAGLNDLVTNSGTVSGAVLLLAGSDRYDGRQGVLIGASSVDGGLGADTLLGGAAEDFFFGDDGNDSLRGGGGDDLLYGGLNDDILNGDAGGDQVFGDEGNDLIRGAAGSDDLIGGDGVDTLSGGEGDDLMVGGLLRDYHVGGAGADVFDFNVVADSPRLTDFDVIRDFHQGEDVIDLTDLVSGALLFQGTGAYAGGGAASLRYAVISSGATEVYIDTDGNGTTEMRIQLTTTHALTAADFIL